MRYRTKDSQIKLFFSLLPSASKSVTLYLMQKKTGESEKPFNISALSGQLLASGRRLQLEAKQSPGIASQ
jgi:hypothetical protein